MDINTLKSKYIGKRFGHLVIKDIVRNNYHSFALCVCDCGVFKKWAETHGYADNLTIERVDVNGDYCEQNCKWIPLSEQLKNTSRSVFITFNGETLCANDWCKRFGLPNNSVIRRYRKGLPLEEVFKLNTKKE